MKRQSDTEQNAQPTSRALTEMVNKKCMTSTPEFLAPQSKKPNDKTNTSDSDENQPPAKRRKPKKNPRKNEAQLVETTTSKQTFKPPSNENATSKSSLTTKSDLLEQNFDLQAIQKRHEQIHAAAVKEAEIEAAELSKPINPDTSCGTSLSSIETGSHSGRSVYSNGIHASNQRERILSAPGQNKNGNMQKQTNQPEVPIEVEDPRLRVIMVDDYFDEDVEEQAKRTESPAEVEDPRKRTISVEDCEIDIETTPHMTRMTYAQGNEYIETVDLSIEDEEEGKDKNNIRAKSLRPAAAGREPHQIDENERPLVPMTKKPNNSFRRHRYKKTPRRMNALEEIKRLQKSVNLLIPKLPFQRLVREIMADQCSGDFHIQGKALSALHEAAEYHLIELFEETVLLCAHRDRATIALKDICLALKLQEHYELKHRCG